MAKKETENLSKSETRHKNLIANANKNIEEIDTESKTDLNKTLLKRERFMKSALKILKAKRIIAVKNKEDLSSVVEEFNSALDKCSEL